MRGWTEALICSVQEKAARTNCTEFHIDQNADSPLCRMCRETITHLGRKLAPIEYEKRHDNMDMSTGNFALKGGFERADKWYEQQPEAVI